MQDLNKDEITSTGDSSEPEIDELEFEHIEGLEPDTVQDEVFNDEPKPDVAPQQGPPVVRIRKCVPARHPLSQRGFIFMIDGVAYRVYDVRTRGRIGVKEIGEVEHGA